VESEIARLIFCTKCGRGGIDESTKFCPNCGVPVERSFALLTCSACQTRVYVSGKTTVHCMTCGSALARGLEA
jgi:rRNA maturation endonuclease Nob1